MSVSSRRAGFVLYLVVMLAGCSSTPQKPPSTSETDTVTPEIREPVLIEVAAVGDIMLGTDYPNDHLPPNDGVELLASMTPELSSADITFGNLEGTLMDGGEPEKKCSHPDRCYLFRSPSRYVQLLQSAGFDVISLANNHARDFGETGRDSSMFALENAGIEHSGRAGDIASWEVKGRKVTLVAFAPFKNSHDMLDIPAAQSIISALSTEHDIVLVSIHAGAEGLEALHIPFEKEFYYGEDRGDVVEFAHAAIDAGADMVIGHGPHVPRALELYKERLIAYSLGNFCTYYGISVTGMKGLAPVVKAVLDQDGTFIRGQIISARQIRPNGPYPDPENSVARIMKDLTEQDFPDTELFMSASGTISKITSSKMLHMTIEQKESLPH